ncbi:ARM-like repeat-containing protein [Metarhizium album ARSEF 1941]|uniref:ARM-like repeat-containing protein n=1 Tax=Metarhizium album (strain ARSEF 1941) TaxID=1081103 RepID=A0A0B2WXD1_METAS|nr:ARM-like repeat-containing protein [Metarhizium album ARSEF 1941]KHN98082.1 ARM-like repeat-containing protein [Metarhizium album ARSEF 1941]
MGNSRRNRAGASQRRDPLAKPVKVPSDPELAALREAKIIPVIEDLRNPDPKSRAAAASAVGNMVHDTKCRKLLLREQVVHIVLAQTLADAALESKVAAWRILQLLAQQEEADFSVHLFRCDILTAIRHAAKAVSEKLSPGGNGSSKLSRAEASFVVAISASLIALLTVLAEAADDILESISSNTTITDFLFVIAAYPSTGNTEFDAVSSLRGDSLACLMVLTEENGNLARKIVTNTKCYQVMTSLKNSVTGDGVLACATLHHVFSALEGLRDPPEIPGADDSLLIPTLAATIASVEPVQHAANGSGQGWSNPVRLQQLALETLASIGTALNSANVDVPGPAKQKEDEGTEDDEDMDDAAVRGSGAEDEQGEEEDGDHEMGQDAMEADMEMVTGVAGDDDEANIDDMPVLKALLQTALPQLIRISSLQPADSDILQLQGHALSALNNIAWSVSLVDFSVDQNAGIQKAWAPVGRALWQHVITPILSSDTADVNLATHVTGLAWAVSRSLGGNTPLAGDEHRKFISLYRATEAMEPRDSEDPFQRLGVKCVGLLGQLAVDPAPVPRNREIGSFLISLLAGLPDTPAADAVEALNQIFDIYASEEFAYDGQVFWKDNFLHQLEAVMHKARAMVKSVDKKRQPELRARADEAVMNLARFLAYKKRHKPDNVSGS